ncbi:MAG: type II secretion system protein, partial [Planctomycetota bacterium]
MTSQMARKERRDKRPRRRGFSLLEMLLALAILGGAAVVLTQITGTGTDAAIESRDLAISRMICQTKLAEILLDAIVTSPVSVPATPVESFDSQSLSQFTYAVEVAPAQLDGLLAIRITVQATQPANENPH